MAEHLVTWRIVGTAAVLASLGACSAAPPPPTPASASTSTLTSTAAPTTTQIPTAPTEASTRPDVVADTLRSMTLEQRVGQLFMVGGPATGVRRATRSAITRYHVGNVMLTGRSAAGVAATARVSAGVRALATGPATAGVPLLVATDQEGGAVQVLRGKGFSRIPTALVQGKWSAARLRTQAAGWGRELRAAGIDLNLAPVADVVPSQTAARANAPIGRFDRQFGVTREVVAEHVVAFDQGMRSAGVATTVKHFPGLGRVRGNPDVSKGVTDETTTRADPDLAPFAQAIDAGVPFVMMATVRYSRIDPGRPAAFSPVVIGDLLRDELEFAGVVISDDLGRARQVADVPAGARAVRFIAAGGDLVLTVDPAVLPAMYGAVLARARADPRFRALVDASAARVLGAKDRQGLLRHRG